MENKRMIVIENTSFLYEVLKVHLIKYIQYRGLVKWYDRGLQNLWWEFDSLIPCKIFKDSRFDYPFSFICCIITICMSKGDFIYGTHPKLFSRS